MSLGPVIKPLICLHTENADVPKTYFSTFYNWYTDLPLIQIKNYIYYRQCI